jgi:hypothetical protein
MGRGRSSKSLEEKVQENLPEFYDSAMGMSVKQLKDQLARDAVYRVENQIAKKADEELKQAQEHARFLAGPYNDAEKMLKMKAEFVKKLLDDKGGNVEQAENQAV